jgi:hypothetical protein
MIATFSISVIIGILILPFIIYVIFKLNDYYGYLQGIKFLIYSAIASTIFGLIIPESTNYKTNISLDIEKMIELSSKEKLITLGIDFLSCYVTLLVLCYCISPLSKAPQNPKSIFHFISGTMLQYIIPCIIFMILPHLAKNEKFAEVIKKHNYEKYLTEEYLFESIKKKISEALYDIGIPLLILFYQKNLIGKGMCYLNYFFPRIFRFLMVYCGLTFLNQFLAFIYVVPFIFGIFYYCKFDGSGKLTNKIKDDTEFD